MVEGIAEKKLDIVGKWVVVWGSNFSETRWLKQRVEKESRAVFMKCL